MPTPNEYDISRAFQRIENDLMDSMVRNLKRHRAEEDELGIKWEQWQALQLKELERYRAENADKFTGDFTQINKKIGDLYNNTYNTAQTDEENMILHDIIGKKFQPKQIKDTEFFSLNDDKLNILLERTKADFTRAEYAVLRRADDAYRKVIFDAQVYANITNDYNKAVDMATHDFIKNGLQSIQYKNGARHNISDYARMAIRTGNKRAYLMGQGNAHDKYGIHTVRVNRRTQACPLCVGFLGRVLVDDVYGGGTAQEASQIGVPTLSSAMQAGFLHPNCKDIYSLYIEGISQPSKPWTHEEIDGIVGEYNQEQALKHAEDMVDSYARLAKYALDPDNKAKYQAMADNWQARADEIQGVTPTPVPTPLPTPVADTLIIADFTDDEREALEWYVSGDGMWINQWLRGRRTSEWGTLPETLDGNEQRLLDLLTTATNRSLESTDKLYRSVDASAIFDGLNESELDDMVKHILYGDSAYDKGAYSQGIKRRIEQALNEAKGKTTTEKGFMSTTVDKRVAEQWGDMTGAGHPVVIEFDTKGKQLRGANLDFLDVEDDLQRERLLARNTRYKITDIGVATDADGMKYIKVNAEIIDQAEDVADVVDTFDRNNIDWSPSGRVLHNRLENTQTAYRQADKMATQLSEQEIIDKIGGADQTKGSCVSVALTYIANKRGLDVLDFRDGTSRSIFSAYGWRDVTKLKGINAIKEATDTVRPTKAVLKQMQEGKEYLLSAGRHTSIVRVNNGAYEYLELQSADHNGWTPFEREVIMFKGTAWEQTEKRTVTKTLQKRFGVSSTPCGEAVIVDIDEYQNSDEFRDLIGYINTAENEQKKGIGGGIK